MDKLSLREQLKTIRAQILYRARKDDEIHQRLETLLGEQLVESDSVFVYISMDTEVDTRQFIQKASAKYTLYYPISSHDGTMVAVKALKFSNLKVNRYGSVASDAVSHAICPAPPLATIVPLLGFCKQSGHRIGYGKGCYDRYFAHCDTLRIGIAYDEQACEFAPDRTDQPLDYVVTPTQLYVFENGRKSTRKEKNRDDSF